MKNRNGKSTIWLHLSLLCAPCRHKMASKVSHDSTALPLATADLIWQVTKKHNSFTRSKRTNVGVTFTAEPNNVLNVASRKVSGLGNSRTVGVEIRRGAKKGPVITLGKDVHTPAKAVARTPLRINNKRSFAVTRSKLSTHRPDLEHLTLVRVARIANSERSVINRSKAPKKE